MKRIVTLAVLLLTPLSAAVAHAMLDHADPRVGSTVTTPPKELALWFTEKLEPAFSTAEVHNAQGTVLSGKARVSGEQLRVPLKPLPPGTYLVKWRVLSVDTHRTQGSFTFTVGH